MRNNAALNINASAAANQVGAAIPAQQCFAASVIAVVTGTAAGTLVLQASNDIAASPTNWVSIPSATVSITGAGTFIIPKLDVSYQWIRASYTFTSGTGTIAAVVNKSGV